MLAAPQPEHVVVDVGSGTGLLTLACAARSRQVWAIDSSRAMGEYLRVKAASAGLENVETVLASAESLPLVDDVADIVVSNYCMHELRDEGKQRALAEIARVLKPGGRLVIGDMMFSLNPLHARDRTVVRAKVRLLAARGLPGIWRLAKNAARLAGGRWESPADAGWWRRELQRAGFVRVEIELLSHEGGVAHAFAPAPAAQGSAHSEATPATGAQGSASSEAAPATVPSERSLARAELSRLR
jgi:ubiquinone/menaquinone biosynthesis C-methylase UbiE